MIHIWQLRNFLNWYNQEELVFDSKHPVSIWLKCQEYTGLLKATVYEKQ